MFNLTPLLAEMN